MPALHEAVGLRLVCEGDDEPRVLSVSLVALPRPVDGRDRAISAVTPACPALMVVVVVVVVAPGRGLGAERAARAIRLDVSLVLGLENALAEGQYALVEVGDAPGEVAAGAVVVEGAAEGVEGQAAAGDADEDEEAGAGARSELVDEAAGDVQLGDLGGAHARELHVVALRGRHEREGADEPRHVLAGLGAPEARRQRVLRDARAHAPHARHVLLAQVVELLQPVLVGQRSLVRVEEDEVVALRLEGVGVAGLDHCVSGEMARVSWLVLSCLVLSFSRLLFEECSLVAGAVAIRLTFEDPSHPTLDVLPLRGETDEVALKQVLARGGQDEHGLRAEGRRGQVRLPLERRVVLVSQLLKHGQTWGLGVEELGHPGASGQRVGLGGGSSA